MCVGRIGIVALALLSACAGSPSAPTPKRQAVKLHNPGGADLQLYQVRLRGADPLMQLGRASTLSLQLPTGIYRLRASTADGRGQDLPLPLHAEAERPPLVELRVATPPSDDDELAPESDLFPAGLWAAALGALPDDAELPITDDDWLLLVGCATLAVERTEDPRRRQWLERLADAPAASARDWALRLLVAQLRRDENEDAAASAQEQLDALRAEHPWLVAEPR